MLVFWGPLRLLWKWSYLILFNVSCTVYIGKGFTNPPETFITPVLSETVTLSPDHSGGDRAAKENSFILIYIFMWIWIRHQIAPKCSLLATHPTCNDHHFHCLLIFSPSLVRLMNTWRNINFNVEPRECIYGRRVRDLLKCKVLENMFLTTWSKKIIPSLWNLRPFNDPGLRILKNHAFIYDRNTGWQSSGPG